MEADGVEPSPNSKESNGRGECGSTDTRSDEGLVDSGMGSVPSVPVNSEPLNIIIQGNDDDEDIDNSPNTSQRDLHALLPTEPLAPRKVSFSSVTGTLVDRSTCSGEEQERSNNYDVLLDEVQITGMLESECPISIVVPTEGGKLHSATSSSASLNLHLPVCDGENVGTDRSTTTGLLETKTNIGASSRKSSKEEQSNIDDDDGKAEPRHKNDAEKIIPVDDLQVLPKQIFNRGGSTQEDPTSLKLLLSGSDICEKMNDEEGAIASDFENISEIHSELQILVRTPSSERRGLWYRWTILLFSLMIVIVVSLVARPRGGIVKKEDKQLLENVELDSTPNTWGESDSSSTPSSFSSTPIPSTAPSRKESDGDDGDGDGRFVPPFFHFLPQHTTRPSESPQPSTEPSLPDDPSQIPTALPSVSPSMSPTKHPIPLPTASPTSLPTTSPSDHPKSSPSTLPTISPTDRPTITTSGHPSASPTTSPSDHPTITSSDHPTITSSDHPTSIPTSSPSISPSDHPTSSPTISPSDHPTSSPTISPSDHPTSSPTISPSDHPTSTPTASPTKYPTHTPTLTPSKSPITLPQRSPTSSPLNHSPFFHRDSKSPSKPPSTFDEASGLSSSGKKKKPNIMVILADDVGTGDIPVYWQSSLVEMPNIDRLAKMGVTFRDAHSTPLCAPSRYMFLSGNYQHRGRHYNGRWNLGYQNNQFQAHQKSIAEVLRDQGGYHTAIFGKWHLGAKVPPHGIQNRTHVLSSSYHDWDQPLIDGPQDIGFDKSYITTGGIQDAPYSFFRDGYLSTNMATDISFWQMGEYDMPLGTSIIRRSGEGDKGWDSTAYNQILVNETQKFIEDHLENRSEDPFFTYVALGSVHVPHSPPDKYADGSPIKGEYPTAHMDLLLEMDKVVGSLVSTIEDNNLAEDTIIMFISDNGGLEWKSKFFHHSSGPLRGKKGQIYEGGHRVPMIMRHDGAFPFDAKRNQLVGLNDIYATICELVGVDIPEGSAQDSVSFAKSIYSEDNAFGIRSSLATWDYQMGVLQAESIRSHNLKLIKNYGRQSGIEVYDLGTDISESDDISGILPEQIKNRMLAELKEIGPCPDDEKGMFTLPDGLEVTCGYFRTNTKQRCSRYEAGALKCNLICGSHKQMCKETLARQQNDGQKDAIFQDDDEVDNLI